MYKETVYTICQVAQNVQPNIQHVVGCAWHTHSCRMHTYTCMVNAREFRITLFSMYNYHRASIYRAICIYSALNNIYL